MAEVFAGQIKAWAFGFCPEGWLPCDGRILTIGQDDGKYNKLFVLIGHMYGGDGRNTFALPDLRGRAQVGQDWKEMHLAGTGGSPTNVLKETPAHTHFFQINNVAGTSQDPTGNLPASMIDPGDERFYTSQPNTSLHPDMVEKSGASAPIENMQPYMAFNYCINWNGYFPSRG